MERIKLIGLLVQDVPTLASLLPEMPELTPITNFPDLSVFAEFEGK